MIRRSKKYTMVIPMLLVMAGFSTLTEVYADEVRYTTTANLNMRTGVGTGNRIILTIPRGRQITYIASRNGWYQVSYGGKSGYVSSAYVKKAKSTPAAPVISAPSAQSGQVRTTGALNIRTGPDKTYKKLGYMPKGTTVNYTEVKNGWYRVTYKGKTGYASGRYLSVLSQPTSVPKAPAIEAAPVSPEAPKESSGETTVVRRYFTTGNLNMRTGPSKGYGIVQVLPRGAELTYLGQSEWYHVTYNGKTGYASNKFIRVVEEVVKAPEKAPEKPVEAPAPENAVKPEAAPSEEAAEPVKEKPAETTTPPAAQAPAPPVVEAEPSAPTGVLEKTEMLYTTTTLNMRTGPGTGNSLILTLPKGVHLKSQGVEKGWHKVSYNGKTGFASGKYLAVNSVYTVDGTIIVNKGLGLPSGFNPGENPEAKAAFNRMNQAAKRAGVRLNLFSGFRTYNYQKNLFNGYVRKNGRAAAETYSARPGFSEHQTGLTFDIGGADQSKWTSAQFGSTKEGKWLAANAPGFGFILRYPEGKQHITGYVYEPWHFRYVGRDLAVKITASGKTLDEYFNVVHPQYK